MPELWLPTIPTEATVPKIWLVDPFGTITALSPVRSWLTWVSSTSALTT